MSKTYKNPNKDKRIKRKESPVHEDRRFSRKVLDDMVEHDQFDEFESFANNRMPFDKRSPRRPDAD